MPNLSIKDVPDELAEALRQRAARNHRSLQGELMSIITQAVAPGVSRFAGAAMGGAGTVEPPPRALTIEEIAARRRTRRSEASLRVPRGVDIIRADRDSR